MAFKWPKWTFPVLIVALAIQLVIPLTTIWNSWKVFSRGEQHFLACAPVDPTDPFRGKYLTLHFAVEDSSYAALPDWKIGDEVYARLEKQADGSSIIAEISTTIPKDPYCKVIISNLFQGTGGFRATIGLPVSRWYVEESKAQELEVRYREHLRNHRPLQAEIRLLKGRMVLAGLHFL